MKLNGSPVRTVHIRLSYLLHLDVCEQCNNIVMVYILQYCLY